MQATDLIVGVLGLLVGAAVASTIAPSPPPSNAPPEAAEPAPEPPAPAGDRDCAAEATRLRDDIELLERRHDTARLIRQAQEIRRAQREGLRQPWPDDVDPALAPDAFEAAVREAAGHADFRVLGLDCAEYPCIATVEKTEDIELTEGSSIRDLDPMLEALEDEIGEFSPAYLSALNLSKQGRYVATFALADRDLDGIEGAKRRLHWRAERAMDRELDP